MAKHRIELTTAYIRPINCALYFAGPKARELEKTEVSQMLGMNAIEHAKSEQALKIELALEKDGSLPFCVDYRMLNDVYVKDINAVPGMDECLDSSGAVRISRR